MEDKTGQNKRSKLSPISIALCLLIGFAILRGSIQSDSTDRKKEAPSTATSEYATTSTARAEATTDSRKIVGYFPNDEPVYEDETCIPEPTYFDEYGTKYILREGTFDDYDIDEDYQEEIDTPESSAFTKIIYHHYHWTMSVQFRNSGVWYNYYDVPPDIWSGFRNADSKGTYFNDFIKGQYEYDRD